MANQPTKYRKFIVGAASAALVASAVAPVASAKDFKDTKGNTHEAAIDALSDAGVITGYEDGTFKPNKTLTRSDVVKLMGKWLVSEGREVPTDYKTNPRFSDLTSSSNDELLKYAAVVKDNGVFNGSNGRLLAGDDITRENMAVVLVRAFDTVEDINLVEYVSGQDFKQEVTDRNSAKSEARTAIDVLDFFDITTVAQFNPKATTTRGHFATFLNNFLKADLSKVTGTVSGVAAVKAVNATTVEVTFADKVENVSGFTIEGLTVSNAAVKQSNDKVVVLTTSVQEGGKKYTVSHAGKELGSFEGVSAVIPTKIDITTQSVQGKTGEQATISANVGVKQAGIPVTFNVKADTKDTLNKDQVFEAVTNEEGVATFSYTQYAAGTDEVVAYPTGAPTVRSHAFVFWGVDTILSVTPQGDKGNSVNNGEDKKYQLTYLDPKTGKPIANQRFFVTFEENVDVNIDKTSKATVNGVNPNQLSNGTTPVVASVTTDAKGQAVFTVSGNNTAVTPVVFIDNKKDNATTYEASKLQSKADKVTFSAIQVQYNIEIEGSLTTSNEAAIMTAEFVNGKDFTAVVTDKDGKLAVNEVVNIALNEDLDRNINTNSKATFVKGYDAAGNPIFAKQITVKTNSIGEAYFTIASADANDYGTPLAWIDINSPNATEGKFDDGEPFKVGPITYFAKEKLTMGALFVTDGNGRVPRADKATFAGDETAKFSFYTSNQSFNPMNLPTGYDRIESTFTIWNTGANDVEVSYVVNGVTKTQIISPNRSHTTPTLSAVEPEISVVSLENKTTSVRVLANGTAQPTNTIGNTLRPINLGSDEKKAEFTSTLAVGTIHTGTVKSLDTVNKRITFEGKSFISYAGATYKNVNAVALTQKEFEELVKANLGTVKVTYKKVGDDVSFEIVSLNPNLSATVEAINEATTPAQVVSALENSGFSPAFSSLNATQKTSVANAVLTSRTSGGLTSYSENRLKAAYSTAYAAEVTTALTNVNTAATATTLAAVPGLDLTAYNALSAADKTAVETILTAGTFADVAALQAAIPAAIAQNEIDKGQAGVNAAVALINTAFNKAATTATAGEITTAKTALTTNASAAGINLTAFNAITVAQQDAALDSIMATGSATTYTAASLQAALNKAVAIATDVTAPTISKAEYNAATGDLVLTFSENVNVSPTATGSIDFINVSNQLGTVATPATTADLDTNTLTISLTKTVADAAGFGVGSKINKFTSLTVADAAGNPLALTGLNITVVAP